MYIQPLLELKLSPGLAQISSSPWLKLTEWNCSWLQSFPRTELRNGWNKKYFKFNEIHARVKVDQYCQNWLFSECNTGNKHLNIEALLWTRFKLQPHIFRVVSHIQRQINFQLLEATTKICQLRSRKKRYFRMEQCILKICNDQRRPQWKVILFYNATEVSLKPKHLF